MILSFGIGGWVIFWRFRGLSGFSRYAQCLAAELLGVAVYCTVGATSLAFFTALASPVADSTAATHC